MSQWKDIRDKDDVSYDPGTKTIDVLVSEDEFGNNYISIPLEFIYNIINEIGGNEQTG